MLRVHRWTGNVFSRIFISGERLRIGDIHVRGATDLFKLRVRGKKKKKKLLYNLSFDANDGTRCWFAPLPSKMDEIIYLKHASSVTFRCKNHSASGTL